jgi:peroxiredoxin
MPSTEGEEALIRNSSTVQGKIIMALVAERSSYPIEGRRRSMNLRTQLQEMSEKFAQQIPPAVAAKMKKAVDDLKGSGIVETSVKEGAKAPDFPVPTATGKTVNSSEYWAKGPTVVSFYRGGWCPFCSLELRALQEALPEITGLGASVVAISPETPDYARSTAEKHGLQFEVLSDVGNEISRKFGLVYTLAEELRPIYEKFGIDLPEHNGDESYELSIPATFVIDQNGTVRKAFVDPDYRKRLDPQEIIEVLQRLKAG